MACSDCKCSKSGTSNSCAPQPPQPQDGPSAAASLSLPRRSANSKTFSSSESTPLWSTTTAPSSTSYGAADGAPASSSSSSSTNAKCDRDDVLRGGVCCRDLRGSDDERTLVDPDVVRDVIIGLSDGLTVPFALTAGLSGVGSTKLVVIAGFAELVSGAISMGVGGFLSAQAEVQHYRFESKRTRERVLRSCSSAVADEVTDILGPYGVPADVAALVANKLAGIENTQASSSSTNGLPLPASAAAANDVLVDEETERGLTPFLLRMGQGLEPISSSRAWQSALLIGLSYFLGGLLPLSPYIFIGDVRTALFVSVGVTALTLLVFGVVKQRATGGRADAAGLVYGAVSTLAVGGLAAGASWGIVRALEGGDV